MTTRWTTEEKQRLDWLSNHLGIELSNVPRTLLWQYFGNNPELQDLYSQATVVKQVLPTRRFSTDEALNRRAHQELSEFCNDIEHANQVINRAVDGYAINRYDNTLDGSVPEDTAELFKEFIKVGFATSLLDVISEMKSEEEQIENVVADQSLCEYMTPMESLFQSAKLTTRPSVQ